MFLKVLFHLCRGNYVHHSVKYLCSVGVACGRKLYQKDNKTTDALNKLLSRFGGQDRKLVMHLSTL